MHPPGSIGILQAAAAGGGGGGGGGCRPSLICFSPVTLSPLLHCLAVTLTPLTPTNILKYRAKSLRWCLFFFPFEGETSLSLPPADVLLSCPPPPSTAVAIFHRRDGRAGRISVFTKQIEVPPSPSPLRPHLPALRSEGASLPLGAGGRERQKGGWPATKTPEPATDLHPPGRHVCVSECVIVCLCVCV